MHLECFWSISPIFLMYFGMPAMADLELEDCTKWLQDSLGYPTYNCSIPENSTIRFPPMPNNWTYVYWRANPSSTRTSILLINYGVLRLFCSKFKDNCFFSEGYLSLSNLKESHQGEYEVSEKEAIKARIHISIAPVKSVPSAAAAVSLDGSLKPFLLPSILFSEFQHQQQRAPLVC